MLTRTMAIAIFLMLVVNFGVTLGAAIDAQETRALLTRITASRQ